MIMRDTLMAPWRTRQAWIGMATGILVLVAAFALQAQPTGGRILSDITVMGSATCKSAKIIFSVPVRYINHFPLSEGDELRIQFKPLATAPIDRQDLLQREAFSPVDDASLLSNVIYEGDMLGGPYLTLQFTTKSRYTVTQGSDFRSIRVSFHPSVARCPDSPTAPK